MTRRVLLKPPGDQIAAGDPCPESLMQEVDCNSHRCTFPCSYQGKEVIGNCSAVCGGGRRAVRHKWIGDGCPEVSDTDSISWIPCNTQPCVVPCETGKERALTECPMHCGPGTVMTFKEIKVKDGTDHKCNADWKEIPCERKKCDPGGLTILQSEKNILPMAGDQYVVGILFSTGDVASNVWIEAPEGYSFGEPGYNCNIESHNLGESLKSCEVLDDSKSIKLDFATNLDPVVPTRKEQDSLDGSYTLYIFVTNPACKTGWKKRTEGGSEICINELDNNQWHLEYSDASPARRHHEIVSKGYELHRMDAEKIPEEAEEEFEGIDPYTDFVSSEPYVQGSYCSRRKACDDGGECNFDLGICSNGETEDWLIPTVGNHHKKTHNASSE